MTKEDRKAKRKQEKERKKKEQKAAAKNYKKKCRVCGESLRTRLECRRHAKERRKKKKR